MAVKKMIQMNASMKKLAQRKSIFGFLHSNNCEISSTVINFISNLKLYREDNQKWLSLAKSPLMYDEHQSFDWKYDDIISSFGGLTYYECESNEIFFDKKDIKGRFWESIRFILSEMENYLMQFFSNNIFCIIISVQFGKMANINVKIHMLRDGEFYLDKDLDNYSQPVLYEILYV